MRCSLSLRGALLGTSPLFLAALLFLGTADLSAQIACSEYKSTYSNSGHTRGFLFRAPVNFVVVGIRVPDELGRGMQTAAVYTLAAQPPAYSASTPATAVWFAKDQPSGQILAPKTPIIVKQGEWFGVLGACYQKGQTNLANSYGSNAYNTQVLGQKIQLQRFMTQTNILSNSGNTNISQIATGTIARIYVYVVGHGRSDAYGVGSTNAAAPLLRQNDDSSASIGTTSTLRVSTSQAQNQGAFLLLGFGRIQIPSVFGDILVRPPFFLTLFAGGAIPAQGRDVSLPYPGDSGLLGLQLNWQSAVVVTPNLFLGNALEQTLGR